MRRIGLPRWARPARPRIIKAPAPPSLLSLIRADQVWELQQRVCKNGSAVMMQVGADPDFWEKQWPRLVRQSCEHVSQKCLGMLLTIVPNWNQATPPVPPQTLAWLLKGLEGHPVLRGLGSLDTGLYATLLPALRKSPLHLRQEDGLRLMKMGGYRSIFHHPDAKPGQEALGLAHADVFLSAWRTWCASKANREQALALLDNDFQALSRFSSGTQMMEEVILEMPLRHRADFLQQVCDKLEVGHTAGVNTPERVRRMTKWHDLFLRNDWGMEHPVWERWGQRLCQALETAPEKGWVGDEWTAVLLRERSESARARTRTESFGALAGWRFTPGMREGLVRTRSHVVQTLLDSQEHGTFLSDQAFAQAGTFFRQTMQTERVLEGWGLGDNATRQHLDAVLTKALGDRWEERLDEVIQEHPTDSASLQRAWTAWKGRHLELDWSEPVAPTRPRPRM